MNKEQRIAIATAFAEEALAGRIPKDAKLLGKGAFARVYEVAGLAVKVQRRETFNSWRGYSVRSQAGRVLESIFTRQIESPHFPKVHAFMGDPTEKWVAVMEKLHKIEHQRIRTTRVVAYTAGRALDRAWAELPLYRNAYERAPLPLQQKKTLRHAMRQLVLAGFAPQDVHSGNIMRRRSRIILTDVVM